MTTNTKAAQANETTTPAASNETKHTPGPWVVVDDAGKGIVTLADVHANDVVVAVLPKVNHANAALIAAAPDLLIALKWADPQCITSPACGACGGCDARAMLDAVTKAVSR